MPFYEYRCAACEAHFEKLVKMDTPPSEVACPSCGAFEAKKQLSSFSVGTTMTQASCGKTVPEGSCQGGGCGFA